MLAFQSIAGPDAPRAMPALAAFGRAMSTGSGDAARLRRIVPRQASDRAGGRGERGGVEAGWQKRLQGLETDMAKREVVFPAGRQALYERHRQDLEARLGVAGSRGLLRDDDLHHDRVGQRSVQLRDTIELKH